MTIDRRGVLAGAVALGLCAPAIAATSARRVFRIDRDGSDIGSHTLSARATGDAMEIEITIRIAVKILGITAYRYEMDNRETWRGGRLIALDSRVNDDGTIEFAKAEATADALKIDGSRFSGPAPADAVTTSYFATPFLKRRPWISTQSGALLNVTTVPEGRRGWWTISGGIETKLGYDDRGEWVGCEFDAGGQLAQYTIAEQSGELGALWANA